MLLVFGVSVFGFNHVVEHADLSAFVLSPSSVYVPFSLSFSFPLLPSLAFFLLFLHFIHLSLLTLNIQYKDKTS